MKQQEKQHEKQPALHPAMSAASAARAAQSAQSDSSDKSDKSDRSDKSDYSDNSGKKAEKKPLREVTYGVFGLMDWTLHIPTPGFRQPFVVACFEGGQLSGYGTAPARFTTRDPYIQQVIEAHPWFNSQLRILSQRPLE